MVCFVPANTLDGSDGATRVDEGTEIACERLAIWTHQMRPTWKSRGSYFSSAVADLFCVLWDENRLNVKPEYGQFSMAKTLAEADGSLLKCRAPALKGGASVTYLWSSSLNPRR
jgi:hypothetical protein